MSSRRERVTLAIVVALLGVVLLVVGGRVWVSATVAEAGFPSVSVDVSGGQAAGIVRAAGLLALAGGAVLLLLRRWGAVAVGVVVAAAGVGSAIAAWSVHSAPADAARGALTDAVGRTGVTPTTLSQSIWPVVAVVVSILLVIAGIAVAIRAPRWERTGRRYEAATGADDEATDEGRPADLWDAIDRGDDPTA